MGNARLRVNGKDLQVNGRFQYVRQVGDIGDISSSNANYTNSFSVIRDNNSTRALSGLGLSGSDSNAPYIRFQGMLYVDELPIIDNNGWAVINETNLSNYKISILDGNIDFWKAIENLNLSHIDLSEANYRKTRQGIIDSFTSPYQKYLLGYYALNEKQKNGYDINLLNPAISDKYILDQIFAHIRMSYQITPEIDTWTIIGRSEESETVDILNLVLETTNGFYIHPYSGGGYDISFDTVDEDEATFNTSTKRITIEQSGNYKTNASWTDLYAKYVLQDRDGMPFNQDLPINHYLSVNGIRRNLNDTVFLTPEDDIFLIFEPLSESQLGEHGFEGYSILAYHGLTTFDYLFELERIDAVYYSFTDELSKISVKDFIKQIMHRYGLTLFYENRKATFLTISERINADAVDLNDYFVEVKNEKYAYNSYAQRNIFRHKYDDETDDFNNGIILINNQNLDFEKTIIESFTYSQDIDGVMRMWDYKGQGEPFEKVKGRFFSARADARWDTVNFRDGENPLPAYTGEISFVDFSKTGYRYYVNEYYKEFQNRILNKSKIKTIQLDMPLSIFLNLDLKKVYYIEQGNFLINKMTYKGLREVELEVVKIN